MKLTTVFLALMLAAGSAWAISDSDVYTLYRNSVTKAAMRVHVATFDTADGHDYNMENCQIAAQLFQKQPGVKTTFWCEKGRYRK